MLAWLLRKLVGPLDEVYAAFDKAPIARGIGVTTWALWAATGIVTLATGDIPGGLGWIGALGGMSGIGSLQNHFHKKLDAAKELIQADPERAERVSGALGLQELR